MVTICINSPHGGVITKVVENTALKAEIEALTSDWKEGDHIIMEVSFDEAR